MLPGVAAELDEGDGAAIFDDDIDNADDDASMASEFLEPDATSSGAEFEVGPGAPTPTGHSVEHPVVLEEPLIAADRQAADDVGMGDAAAAASGEAGDAVEPLRAAEPAAAAAAEMGVVGDLPAEIGASDRAPRAVARRATHPDSIPDWGGRFALTFSQTIGCPLGRWVSVCPYHKKNEKTACTRTFCLTDASDWHRCRLHAKHWSLQAGAYKRKRHHGEHPMIASEILPDDIMDMKVLEMAVPLDRHLRMDDLELDALDGVEPPPESSGLDEPVARGGAVGAAAAVPEAAAAGPEEDERSDDADPVHDSDNDSDGSGPGPDEVGPDSPDPTVSSYSNSSDSSSS